ncbi:myoneurin-like isoform X2 [Pectinophora gossypiella]|uniref:myoneurin-like isoform X2 n=1 Tax=Pectinophora gossypiella TaxID=13191 RepID=UPI00214F158B|nr:myoneurin-like isoform X2 [Pectinophora gossypiella]
MMTHLCFNFPWSIKHLHIKPMIVTMNQHVQASETLCRIFSKRMRSPIRRQESSKRLLRRRQMFWMIHWTLIGCRTMSLLIQIFTLILTKKILLSSTPSSDKQISADNENIPVTITEENLENIHTENLETQDTAEFSEENNQIDNAGKQIEINEIEDNKDNIDLNLEKALKNTDNTQFSLDDLLVTPKSDARLATPPLQPGTSGFSTPTIPNIIYDITVDVTPFEENSNSPQAEHGIENVEGSESGILDDFFNKDTGEYIGDITKNQEKEIFEDFQAQDTVPLENSDKSKYDLSNLSCLLCTKKYNTLKALKIHFAKLHKFKILGSRKIVTDVICDHCGKTYRQLNSLKEHIKVKHYNENTKLFEKIKSKDSYNYKCKLCSLAYISRRTLSKHMTTHTGKRVLNTGNKKFVCDVCSFACSNVSNLKTHIRRRHTKEYLHHCSECGRGFYRKTELDTHMRSHNGDRPYLCIYCAKSFSRCDSLNTHMKQHTNERRFVCTFCESSFVSASYLNWHLKSSKTCRRLRLGEYFIDGAGENYLKWTVSVPDYNQRKHGKQLTPVAEDIEMTDLLDMDREGPLDCDSADLPDIAEDGTVNRAVNVASEGLPTDIDSLEI